MSTAAVLHEKRDRAFWITINRPDKRNALKAGASRMPIPKCAPSC
jgi:enoyl-CoA hydratase/carnithine racemase